MLPTLNELMISGPIALIAVLVTFIFIDRRRRDPASNVATHRPEPEGALYLFEDQRLIDANDVGSRLLADRFDNMREWEALTITLQDDFPQLDQLIKDVSEDRDLTIPSCLDPNFILSASQVQGRLRLKLSGLRADQTPDLLVKLEQRSLRNELTTLRAVAETTPQLIWQEDETGEITWCNRSYLRFFDSLQSEGDAALSVWPAQKLFPSIGTPNKGAGTALRSRHSVLSADEKEEHWFNITSLPVLEGTIHFASDANEQLKSERAQKAFIQTFAKTFAQLSVGLAIFDRSRNLSMFNPAFLDMTGLPANLLSSRPSIETVFDQMRLAGKLPEPKDYSVWKEQFRKLLDEASTGTYQENWVLPDGQTFRVAGRPHPDGAIAFLFEDITAEISLTRRFRTEVQTSQAVLDSFEDAIAVFSPAQTMVLSNTAYHTLWGEPDQQVSALDLRSSLRHWKSGSAPSAVWAKIEKLSDSSKQRKALKENIVLKNGLNMVLQTQPLPGGMTMMKFRRASGSTTTQSAPKQISKAQSAHS